MPPSFWRLAALTALTLLAFAGNSLLCRLALRDTGMDAGVFTAVRLASGALVLALVVRLARREAVGEGNWGSALALLAYAAGFSYAYLSLPTGTGALLLFGAVQATMIGHGLWCGERLRARQWLGLAVALAGLVGLMLPGLAPPPLLGSLLMLGAGASWGVYSLRGRRGGDATRVTAGNFLRSVPLALLVLPVLEALLVPSAEAGLAWSAAGLACALASGAITSGLGYALWYHVLPELKATQAATLQLSVPVIATVLAVPLLAEPLTLRLLLASAAVLGGIALVIRGR